MMQALGGQVRFGGTGTIGEYRGAARALGVVALVDGDSAAFERDVEHRFAAVFHSHRLATLLLEHPGHGAVGSGSREAAAVPLVRQLDEAVEWIAAQPELVRVRVGLFALVGGSVAALRVAADRPGRVGALVSHMGRPDLSADVLERVEAPTLLIVGGDAPEVLAGNRRAMQRLRCNKRLEVVPGAGNAFHEPGTLEAVAHLAGAWFATHLPTARSP